MTTITEKDNLEVADLVKQIEETLSGHRIRIVNSVLDKIKSKVADMSVFKRPHDI
jgi:hypothetical protein